MDTLVGGVVEAPINGGCLSLIASLVGTPWQMDFANQIFFFEDTDDEPYRIDRALTQLLASGSLAECVGIVIGEHKNCIPRRPEPSLDLEQVFADLLIPLGLPTIYNLPLGHGAHFATLPLGARVKLDADLGCLNVLDAGVL